MKRSNAVSLLENGADDDEVQTAITDRLREELPAAYKGLMRELAGPPEGELLAEVTKFVGLVGQNWSKDGRLEFIDLATDELLEIPGSLVLGSLARARRRVTDGRFLVSWIIDDVQMRLSKLQVEREHLERLMALTSRG